MSSNIKRNYSNSKLMHPKRHTVHPLAVAMVMQSSIGEKKTFKFHHEPSMSQQLEPIRSNKDHPIVEIIYESALDSTGHGIPHIFTRHKNPLVRIMWFVCFLAASGCCAWINTTSISDFFDYEAVSKTETILEIPTAFPTVSLCNINPFVTNYSIQFVQMILNQTKNQTVGCH